MRSVLITRPQPAADEFAEKLTRDGFTAHVAPMMEYVPVAADFLGFDIYQALIFTSAQAVEAFASLSTERAKPVLAVGDATAATATRAGFVQVYSAKGNSVDVASLIRAEASKLGLRKILHLCSADTPDDIGPAVASLGVSVERLPIYKAQLVPDFPPAVTQALQEGKIDVVLVFSARTAENFARILTQKGLKGVSQKLEIICISDQVARAIRGLPWRIVRVARQPRMEAVMTALREHESGSKASVQERRQRGPDRRQKPAYRDANGFIDAENYKGPERRIMSRRAHENRQKQRVWQEKVRFMNRTMLTAAFVFMAIVLAGVFVMAPEYADLSKKPDWIKSLRERVKFGGGGDSSLGGILNSGIEQANRAGLSGAATQIASDALHTITTSGQADFTRILNGVMYLRNQQGGDAAIAASLTNLRSLLLSPTVQRAEDIGQAVESARDSDPTLSAMLSGAKKEDLAAAAMLLVLNEFRNAVDGNRPYKDDLALLRRFAGSDPAMNRALMRLAPHAEKGVMNRSALQAELKSLGREIIMAQLQGQDISMRDAAEKRFERLSKAGSVDKVKGETTDAVVARAQILLDQGDVPGAMRELQTLEGPGAGVAKPWLGNASSYVVADRAADDVTRHLLNSLGGNLSVQGVVDAIKGTLRGSTVPYVSPAMTRGNSINNSILVPQQPGMP